MTDKLEALEGLLGEVSTALVDLVGAMEARGEAGSATAAALIDLVSAIEKRKDPDHSAIVAAIKGLQLAPRIDVHPAPVQVLPAPALAARTEHWDVQLFDEDGKARGRMAISKTTTPQALITDPLTKER